MRKSVFMIEGIQVAVASPEYWASRQGQKDQREGWQVCEYCELKAVFIPAAYEKWRGKEVPHDE
jgi:hypothetical protein